MRLGSLSPIYVTAAVHAPVNHRRKAGHLEMHLDVSKSILGKNNRVFPELLTWGQLLLILKPYGKAAFQDWFPRWRKEENRENKQSNNKTSCVTVSRDFLPSGITTTNVETVIDCECTMRIDCHECREHCNQSAWRMGRCEPRRRQNKPEPACGKRYYNRTKCKDWLKVTFDLCGMRYEGEAPFNVCNFELRISKTEASSMSDDDGK